MKVIPYSKLPKRHYTLAAECRCDFEEIIEALKVKTNRGTFRDGLIFPKRYRFVCLELSTGRYGTLTQTELDPSTTEIGLEVKEHKFHEADLLEVVKTLGIALADVERMQGDFIWIPAKSK